MSSIREIQDAVARRFGVTRLDLISHRRTKAIYRPRQVAMWIASRATIHSQAEIGRQFGDRDHTTVGHDIRKVEQLMRDDAQFMADVLRVLDAVDHRESGDIRRAMMRAVA